LPGEQWIALHQTPAVQSHQGRWPAESSPFRFPPRRASLPAVRSGDLASSRTVLFQSGFPKGQTHLDCCPFPLLMNRDPDLRVRQRTSPIPAGTESSIGSAVSSGEEENQAMHVLCASALHFSHGIPEVSNTRWRKWSPLASARCCLWKVGWRSPWRKKSCLSPEEKNPSPGT
jgi:hypothetical protein